MPPKFDIRSEDLLGKCEAHRLYERLLLGLDTYATKEEQPATRIG